MTHLTDDCAALIIERHFPQGVATVWAAFTEMDRRRNWFRTPPEATDIDRVYDFSVGGGEVWKAEWNTGMITEFRSRIHAIEPERRLTYTFDVLRAGELFSVSLTDVTFAEAAGGGTDLVMMEALAYHAEGDRKEMHENRILGTARQFDWLKDYLDAA